MIVSFRIYGTGDQKIVAEGHRKTAAMVLPIHGGLHSLIIRGGCKIAG